MDSLVARTSHARAAVLALLLAVALVPRAMAQAPATADAKLDAHWAALASEQADEAAAAIDALAADPAATLALVDGNLGSLPDLAPRVRDLVIKLNAATFAEREQAESQLAALGALAEPELRRLHAAGLPLEAKTRVEKLLALRIGPYATTAHDRRLVSITQLLSRLDDPQARTLLVALKPVRTLAIVDGRVAPLYQQLYSADPAARAAAAVELLAHPADATAAIPRLIELLGDIGPLVTIGQFGRRVADHVAESLPKLGPQIVPPLIAVVEHENPEVRKRAVSLLGNMHDERAIPPLITRLEKPDKECISELVNAVGDFRTAATPPLLAALETSNADNQGYLLSALAETGDPAAAEPIARRLRDPDPLIRKWAIASLEKLKSRSLDELIAAFRDEDANLRSDAEVRATLFRLICSSNDPRAAALVVEAFGDHHPDVRAHAFYDVMFRNKDALRDPAVVETIMAAINDDAPRVRAAVAQLMGETQRFETQTAFDRDRVCQALVAALDDDAPQVKIAAAHSLGYWRRAEAVEPLIAALDDNSSDDLSVIRVSLAAAEALAEIGDPRAMEPIRRVFATNSNPRLIRAVGNFHDHEAVPRLIELLDDAEDEIQEAAAEALGEIGDPRAIDALAAKLDHQRRFHDVAAAAARALGGIDDPRVFEPLVAALSGPQTAANAAARALGELGDPRAIAPLIEFSRHGADIVYSGPPMQPPRPEDYPATEALRQFGWHAIKPLVAALSDESTTAREVAACVLADMHYQDGIDDLDMQPAVEPLAAALTDQSDVVRSQAAVVLGWLGDKRAVPALLEVMRIVPDNAYDAYRPMNAASYLSRIKDPESVPPLIAMLAHNRPKVRACAARALGYLHDERGFKPLLPLLDDGAPDVRLEVVNALGRFANPAAIERLKPFLTDDSPELRAAAAESLGRIGGESVADALAPLVDDPDPKVRVTTGMALIRLDDPRGVPVLERAVNDSDRKQRESTIQIIIFAFLRSERLIPPLVRALDDPSIRVRLYAAPALGRNGTDAAVDALIAKLDDHENLRNIVQALGASKHPRAYPVVLAHLKESDPATQAAAAYQLGDSGNLDYAEPLIEQLDDPAPEVRIAAIDALVKLHATSAIPNLTAAFDEPDPKVARHVARAIERLSP